MDPISPQRPTTLFLSGKNCGAIMLDKSAAHCGKSGGEIRGNIRAGRMKSSIRIFSFLVASFWAAVLPANAQVNVTQKNNNLSRDGLYIDAAFTPSNAANLVRDLNFDG